MSCATNDCTMILIEQFLFVDNESIYFSHYLDYEGCEEKLNVCKCSMSQARRKTMPSVMIVLINKNILIRGDAMQCGFKK